MNFMLLQLGFDDFIFSQNYNMTATDGRQGDAHNKTYVHTTSDANSICTLNTPNDRYLNPIYEEELIM